VESAPYSVHLADGLILSNLVPPSTQPAQQCGHVVQLHLAALALRFVRGFADNRDISNGGAFQRRSACDFEILPAVRVGHLAVALGDVRRNRLARPLPLVPCGAVNPDEGFSIPPNALTWPHRVTEGIARLRDPLFPKPRREFFP